MLPGELADQPKGRVDEAWYWLTPILLDLADEPEAVWAWWARDDLAGQWSWDKRQAAATGWNEHIDHAWETAPRGIW